MVKRKRPERGVEDRTAHGGFDARICVEVTLPPAKPTAEDVFGAFLEDKETGE